MKTKEVVQAEESLREFILDEFTNTPEERERADIYKYKGLTLTVVIEKNAVPYFIVQIGVLEASFSIENGRKIDGGLQDFDVSMVQKWAMRSHNRSLLQKILEYENKEKHVKLQPFDLI